MPKEKGLLAATPICAIGASAGGLAALQKFFESIRTEIGLAYVVVVHLSPDHPSQLADILAAHTTMPVTQVENSTQLKPDSVYVIPPDRELVIRGNDVEAHRFSEPRGRRMPIDSFFRSVSGARADGVAVVMSGSGSDGALGVRAVKEAGGIIFVQDPAEAEYDMMPRSAITTGAADFVGPVARIAAEIAEVVQAKRVLRETDGEEAEIAVRQIIGLLRARTGHDFSSYKFSTVLRRINRRMQVTRQESLASYYRYLEKNGEETQELFSDLLISVTMFFRDRDAFAAFEKKVIEPIFEKMQPSSGIRAWVVGCATGEEAYSLGMALLEEAGKRKMNPSIQIFASDLDEGALAIAREGRYPKAIEADVPEERLHRFFVEEGVNYRVRNELRDLILFTTHSALKDPPFIKLDLITCRNLLIYLKRDLQVQLCRLFHYALKPGGYLFVGSAETADVAPSLFQAVDRDARIYEARPVEARVAPILPQLSADYQQGERHFKQLPFVDSTARAVQMHVAMLEKLAPPSVLVDNAQRILHLSPTAGRYFLPPGGPFSAELPEQVRPELRVDLKLALQHAYEKGQATLTLPLPVAFNGGRRMTALHVLPCGPKDGGLAAQALVFFIDAGDEKAAPANNGGEDAGAGEVKRLRQELSLAHDHLSAGRLEYERATQDLRAANEELQSMNEEYRSTAEELETSKEELQSINEELQTVNAELKSKLETISSAHNDLMNLMSATEIGALFLDADLKIKLFTPVVGKLFNIENADIGRPITHFTHLLDYDNLESDAKGVLSSFIPFEREVSARGGRWLTMRIGTYRTVEGKIEGVVITLADITARKHAEDALAEELRAMTGLQQMSTNVVQANELDALLMVLLDAAIDLMHADFGNVQLYDEDTRTLRIAGQRGFKKRFLDHFRKVDTSEGSACGMALAAGQAVLLEDVEKEPLFAPSLAEAKAAGYRAVLSVPLRTTAGKLVGILSVHFRDPHQFTNHDRLLADIFARQAADAINTFQLQQIVRESEIRLRKVLETETVGVLYFNNAGVLVDCNEAFLHMSGYSRHEVEAGELTWRKMTPPEWAGQSEKQFGNLDETGRIGPYEKEYIRKDGSRRRLLLVGRRIEPDLITKYAIDIGDSVWPESSLTA